MRWNGEAPPRIGTCCLAKSWRDTGQSREPEPPQRIAGTIRAEAEASSVAGNGERDVIGGHPSGLAGEGCDDERVGQGGALLADTWLTIAILHAGAVPEGTRRLALDSTDAGGAQTRRRRCG